MAQENQDQQVQVKFSEQMLEGKYSNQMIVRHTSEEFVLDFFNFIPGDPQATVVSRVVIAPTHMKRIIATLEDNFKKFEKNFGTIKELSIQSPPVDTNSTSEHTYGFDTNKAA